MDRKTMMSMMAAMALFAAQGYAQEGEAADGKTCDMQGMHEGKGAHGEALTKELGLTEEQAAKMKAHFEKMKANRPDHKAMKAKNEQFKAMMDDYNASKAHMIALANEIADEQKQKMIERIEATAELKTILTAEQFAKFQAQKKAKREERKQNRGKGMGEGEQK